MPAPSVIRAERSLHPQRHEPGWLETPCPEGGSCRTVGDPRLRQLAADTGDHATGRSAARFAPPWEIPRGGANRRSVDRFIPRLWGNIGPAWSPSMSIPAHPHARGEHQAASAAATIDDGSSPHPWGTRKRNRLLPAAVRFIPTPVGNTPRSAIQLDQGSVHPHTRGEHQWMSQTVSVGAGSSPHPWGTPESSSHRPCETRFIPTPVGNTPCCSTAPSALPVHPHTRGEHRRRHELLQPLRGSSPPCETRFIPTPVGNTDLVLAKITVLPVHPHTRGEHPYRIPLF